MKKLATLFNLALLGAVSLASLSIKPAIARCIPGNMPCSPKDWICIPVPGGCNEPPPTIIKPGPNPILSQEPGTRLRPDLNGLQLRNPGNGAIYWVDEGKIRHIVNPSVYTNLFIPKSLNAIDTVSIMQGPSVTDANRLVRCGEGNHPLKNRIYFLDQGTKRHIASPTVMDRNNFNWGKVKNVDCPALASIPDGASIK